MTDSYQEIMARILPLYEQAPERFMRFYNAVWLMCHELPEGGRFRIADRCAEKSIPLFRDIAALCIMDEPYDVCKGTLEFEDETMEWVHRGNAIKQPDKKSASAWSPLNR